MFDNLDHSLDSTGGGFMSESVSGASAKNDGNSKRAQNIVPVMIRHLISSFDELQLWNMPIRIVTFVGILRNIVEQTTKTTYEIEDDTGTIKAFRWMEADNNQSQPTLPINSYVRVYGSLREHHEEKHVLVLHIKTLTDLNELTNHFLQVTYVALKAEKMASTDAQTDTCIEMNDINMSDNSCNGMTKEQTIVFKIIQAQSDSDCGIERCDIKAQIPRSLLPRVDDIIDFLTCEGHIYTTRTNDHFKTT